MGDVIIIGSGLVGSAMAVALAQAGMAVDLVDAAPLSQRVSAGYDGRTSAIALGSIRVLKTLGVWQRIGEMSPICDIRVCDEGGKFFVHYDHREAEGEPFGQMVENRLLREALYDAVEAEKNITLHQPVMLDSLTQNTASVSAHLSNGETITAPLMIAADGKFSKVREMLGIGSKRLEYGQTAIVCTITHSKPHHGLAVEKFLPAGPFAMLPMTHNRSNLVWAEAHDMAARMLELDEAERLREIKKRVGDHLGEIESVSPCHSYPLMLILADDYVSDRVALIGDAGHGIHPVAGQGVNIGYRDVAVLTELLVKQAQLGLDIGASDVLAHYRQWRKLDVTSMSAVTDGLVRLFSNRSTPLRIARDVGMGAVNRILPLKQFLMRDAMGLTGDLPAMMRAPETQTETSDAA